MTMPGAGFVQSCLLTQQRLLVHGGHLVNGCGLLLLAVGPCAFAQLQLATVCLVCCFAANRGWRGLPLALHSCMLYGHGHGLTIWDEDEERTCRRWEHKGVVWCAMARKRSSGAASALSARWAWCTTAFKQPSWVVQPVRPKRRACTVGMPWPCYGRLHAAAQHSWPFWDGAPAQHDRFYACLHSLVEVKVRARSEHRLPCVGSCMAACAVQRGSLQQRFCGGSVRSPYTHMRRFCVWCSEVKVCVGHAPACGAVHGHVVWLLK